jgi:hypothetical protein
MNLCTLAVIWCSASSSNDCGALGSLPHQRSSPTLK